MRWLAGLFRRWAMKRARWDAEYVFRAARATMRRKKLALLATQAHGEVDARVLQPFPPEEDLIVYMGTRRGSRKAQQIEASGRATYVGATDTTAFDAFKALARHEGIIPALESAHAVAYALELIEREPDALVVVGLSGRGDKDMGQVQRLLESEAMLEAAE